MPLTPSLLVAQITDTHLFADQNNALIGLPTAASFQSVLAKIQTLHPQPDVLLLTGDLSQDETAESYQQVKAQVTSLNIPTYWLPGNHDRPLLMQQILQGNCISSENQLELGGWNFLLLDSSVPGTVHGQLSNQSVAWLEQQLQARPNHPTLVALHHPPVAIGSTWMDQINLHNADALFAVLERHDQVKLVLFGHIHQEFDHQRRGIRYLGTPSTCVQFKPESKEFAVDERSPGFRLLTLYPNGDFSTRIERVTCEHSFDLAATGY